MINNLFKFLFDPKKKNDYKKGYDALYTPTLFINKNPYACIYNTYTAKTDNIRNNNLHIEQTVSISKEN